MANVVLRFRLSMFDTEGVRTATDVYGVFPDTVTLAQLKTDLSTLGADVAACSDCAFLVAEATSHFSAADLSLATTPPGEESVSALGALQFVLKDPAGVNDTTNSWSYFIPGIKDTLVSGGKLITTALGPIDTLTTFLNSAIHTTGHFTNPGQLDLSARRATFLSDRKHRRQLHSKSYTRG